MSQQMASYGGLKKSFYPKTREFKYVRIYLFYQNPFQFSFNIEKIKKL